MDDKTVELRRQMAKLSQLSDQDFVREIENMSIATDFEKAFQIGSRNVNLWTVLGAGTGGFVGGPFLGSIGGAAIGALIDKHGPKAAKRILEQVVSIKGLPSVQKISKLDLPKDIKTELTNSFRNAFVVGVYNNDPISIEPEMVEDIKKEISLSETLTPLEKAKNLAMLNKTGQIKNLKKLVGGKEIQSQEIEPLIPRKKEAKSFSEVADFTRNRRPEDY
jgi:hypothetical protein